MRSLYQGCFILMKFMVTLRLQNSMAMKKLFLLSFVLFAVALNVDAAVTLPDSVLRRMAAKMLMVGFKGDSVTSGSDAARYVRDLKVGGIILFDVDLTGTAKIGSRNVTSKERLTKMTADLRRYAGGDLLIAIDQEGGMVRRLRPEYGYSPTVSQEYLGKINSRDTTMKYAGRMAKEIKESGVNVNLAPLIDVNVNPDCPVIGALHRSYSSDTAIVSNNAKWSIEAHHRNGVLCAVKHFPGHGSSASDSHYGLTDVTLTATDARGEETSCTFSVLVRDGSQDVDLYPNPVKDFLNIRTGKPVTAEITVSNKAGAAVLTMKDAEMAPFAPLAIDMKNLPGGIYYVRVKGEGIDTSRPVAKQ